MGIMVSLSVVGISRYLDFNYKQTLVGEALSLKARLRDAQVKTTSGTKPTGCSSLDGHRITFTASTYQIRAVCSGALTGPTTTFALPTTYSFNPTPAAINFRVLGEGTDAAGSVITIRAYQNPTRYYRLCIDTGGDINDCGYGRGTAPTCSC